MGRYRPPQAVSSPYISAQGYEDLQSELKALWVRRKDVTIALTAAAAEGDRSENAEYIYRKKELREIDRRIRYLQKRLPVLKVVAGQPEKTDQVFFGAWVVLEDKTGEQHCYRLVGADETQTDKRYISIDAPMAKALLKRHLEDEINVQTPTGLQQYLIISIRY